VLTSVVTVMIRASKETEGDAESCPVCAEHSNQPIYPVVQDPITLDFFQVVQCSACHLVFTIPRPEAMQRYYPEKYRDYGTAVRRILKALYSLRVSRWLRLKPEGGSVLEVGCGSGLMLAAFQRRGWRALGVERSEEVTRTVHTAPGVKIVTTPVEALSADIAFDLIVLFQVLEHIADPVTLLRECARRLAPGGHVIVNVPNFSSWQSRFAGARWLHLDPPRHQSHFTPQTLASTLERAGLCVKELSFASPEHDPYGWVESAINRSTGHLNILTRFLMRLDPFGPEVLLSFLLGAVLILPASLLAAASWPAKKGALMEAIAIHSLPSEKK
jgi:2-polyprenyl-3-methyl-5-hydroxy-6-metoxy-1,4-benzoquinol methylase